MWCDQSLYCLVGCGELYEVEPEHLVCGDAVVWWVMCSITVWCVGLCGGTKALTQWFGVCVLWCVGLCGWTKVPSGSVSCVVEPDHLLCGVVGCVVPKGR